MAHRRKAKKRAAREARQRKAEARRAKRKLAVAAAAGVVLVGVVIAYTVVTGGDLLGAGGSGSCTYTPTGGFADLHGLAVNPERPNELFAATHNGLVRAVDDADWALVGRARDDYMGFSLHPTNGSIMWSSGHPRGGGNIGVQRSLDGGCTWERTALGGVVDFHAMTVSRADPDHLWGYWQGKVYRTTDGGHDWNVASSNLPPVISFAAHPTASETLLGTTQQGIYKSVDGGASWSLLAEGAAFGIAFLPTDPDVTYASTQAGLFRSEDGGSNWTAMALDADGGLIGYIALDSANPSVIYAGTYQVGIYKSVDGGASWTRIKAPAR